jgi:hypothetical protein
VGHVKAVVANQDRIVCSSCAMPESGKCQCQAINPLGLLHNAIFFSADEILIIALWMAR